MSEWVEKGKYGELPPIRDKMNYLKDVTDYLLSLTGNTVGTDGSSGSSGSSGTSGTDGTSGSSGTSGIDGTNGTSGSSGVDGIDASGIFGGNSILYKFNTSVTLDSPNSGYLKINNTSPSLATKLIVDYRNLDGSFVDTWLRSISSNTSSYFRLFKEDNSAIFCVYKILDMVDNGVLSKCVTFDVEIVYADDSKFFNLDDEVVLSYTESGGSSETTITIPQLKLDTGYYTSNVINSVVTDTLRCYWESTNTEFLNYNPEVWVFRRKTYSRKNITNDSIIRHKKWTHEPHLNGIKFLGGQYYSGSIKCPVSEIESTGRHTEFELTSSVSGQKSIIPLDPYEYIYGYSGGTFVKLSDDIDFDTLSKVKVTGRRKSKSLPLRFAIVIDNPDTSADNPKIIGNLSDVVYMRYGRDDGNGCKIKYFWNEIEISMFKSGRFT